MTKEGERSHRAHVHAQLPEMVVPYDLLGRLGEHAHVCLLDGTHDVGPTSRYSMLGLDPYLVFRCKRSQAYVGPPGREVAVPGKPLDVLQRLLEEHGDTIRDRPSDFPPLYAGAIGYLGYECLYELEDIPDTGRDDVDAPDGFFLFCHALVVTDKLARKTWVVGTGVGDTRAAALDMADAKRRAIGDLVARPAAADPRESILARRRARAATRPRLLEEHLREAGVQPVVSRDRYLDIVQRARDHIFAGDIFEVCTTQRFGTTYDGSGVDLYRILRTISDAPFSAYLRLPGLELMSASPERYMRLDADRWAETRPIKGTRPRGRTPAEDRALYDDLDTCEKDRAENLMIVDLARNDLGRVCEFKTVTVPQMLSIESFPFTHQLVSTVRGRLRAGLGAVDLVRASFPGGSMTGAPKVEAMKIIDALEPVKRGVFSGGIGYFDADGAFDMSIVIRTIVRTAAGLTFHVGGAIVADSDPAEEYQETLDKAHNLVTAIELAREGL